MANQCELGTLAFAVKDSMEQLGAQRVADLLKVSADSLYKATSPGTSRKVPKLGWYEVQALCDELRRNGKRELFSVVLSKANSRQDLSTVMLSVTSGLGALAMSVAEATAENSPGGAYITASEAAKVGQAAADIINAANEVIATLAADTRKQSV